MGSTLKYLVNGSDFVSNTSYAADAELQTLFAKIKDKQQSRQELVEKFFNKEFNDVVKNYSKERMMFYANRLIKNFIENAEKHYGSKDISDLVSYVSAIDDVKIPEKENIDSKAFEFYLPAFKSAIFEAIDKMLADDVASAFAISDKEISDEIEEIRSKEPNIDKGEYANNKRKLDSIVNFRKLNSKVESVVEKNIYRRADKIRLDLPRPIAKLRLFLNRREPRKPTLKQKIGRMMPHSLRVINYKYMVFEQFLSNFTVKGILYHLRRFVKFMGKKLLNVVDLVIPIKTMMAVFKGVRITLNFVRIQIARVINFAYRIKRTIVGIATKAYLLLKNSYLAISKYTLTTDIFKAFIKTYLGAYFLGYAIGFIYKNTKNIIDSAKNWIAYALEKTREIREIASTIFDTFIAGPLDSIISFLVDIFDQARFGDGEGIIGTAEDIASNLRNGTTGARLDIFKPFEELENVSRWILSVFEDVNIKEIKNYVIGFMTSAGLQMLKGIGWSAVGGLIGTLIVPGIGTVAGSVLGAFVPDVVDYLITDEKYNKLKDSHSNLFYSQMNSMFYGEGTSTSDLATMFSRGSEAEGFTMFGSLFSNIDEYINDREHGRLTKDSNRFLIDLGFNATNPKTASGIVDFFNKLRTTLTVDKVFKELNSSFMLLHEMKDNLYYKSKEEEIGDTKLHIDGMGKSLFAQNKDFSERDKLAYRIFRAIVLGQTIPLIANNRITPKSVMQLYSDLQMPSKFMKRDAHGVRSFSNIGGLIADNNLITSKQLDILNNILFAPFSRVAADLTGPEAVDSKNSGSLWTQFHKYIGKTQTEFRKELGTKNPYVMKEGYGRDFFGSLIRLNQKDIFEEIGLNYQTANEIVRFNEITKETSTAGSNRGNADEILRNLEFQKKKIELAEGISSKALGEALQTAFKTTADFANTSSSLDSATKLKIIKDMIDTLNQKMRNASVDPNIVIGLEKSIKDTFGDNITLQDALPSEF